MNRPLTPRATPSSRISLQDSFRSCYLLNSNGRPREFDPGPRNEKRIRFYFAHSYHVRPEEQQDELVTALYGYEFTVGIEKDNLIGVQFHPEKSHRFGMQLLKNFGENY